MWLLHFKKVFKDKRSLLDCQIYVRTDRFVFYPYSWIVLFSAVYLLPYKHIARMGLSSILSVYTMSIEFRNVVSDHLHSAARWEPTKKSKYPNTL